MDAHPERLLDYVYAVLNWPSYRTRYADALRYDFARIPLTKDAGSFKRVSRLGEELVALHLLEHPDVAGAMPALDGDDTATIEQPHYVEAEAAVYLAPALVARDIQPAVWRYQQGAYPVLRNSLEARQGRRLTSDEFVEFRRLAGAIHLTLERLVDLEQIMPEVMTTALTADELLGPLVS
ncbi:MAG: hypothetical protein H0V45_06260 [Actinobacteria bacterium]|nr:hypothetical protein [Actinomycetota bacterium]